MGLSGQAELGLLYWNGFHLAARQQWPHANPAPQKGLQVLLPPEIPVLLLTQEKESRVAT